jgi:hypothetical protein
MELSSREIWTVLHGMLFGAIFLLAFGGGLAGLYSLRPQLLTPSGVTERVRRLKLGMWTMAAIAWITVISGTWIVYIWYRAKPTPGADLAHFPKFFLIANKSTAEWHEFGMEWKEHVAWLAPLAITSAAYVVQVYGRRLTDLPLLRRTVTAILIVSFGAAAAAGIFGAFINKVAATR